MQSKFPQIEFKKIFLKKEMLFIIVLLSSAIFIWAVLLLISMMVDDSALGSKKTLQITIPPTAPYIEDRLIIRFKDGVERTESMDKALKKAGIVFYENLYQTKNSVSDKFYLAHLEKGSDIVQVQKNLQNLDFLYSTEPKFISTLFSTPNDPLYSKQWGMDKIHASQAWDIVNGGKDIVVAVIDTGVSLEHPDLKANLVEGIDIINNDADPSDDMGHGSHIAGIIGAVGNNKLGVTGVNWYVKIMPIRVCNSAPPPLGSTCFPEEGIYYATDNGAKVINLSVGLETRCSEGGQYQTAIDYAVSRGVVVVAASGNSSSDAINSSPASCRGVISVGATTRDDSRSIFSNYGETVLISAPGEGILSTWITGERVSQGTSMSGPFVTGASALLLSKNPGLSPRQVKDCLVDNADSISTDFPIGKRLNAYKAITACSSIKAEKISEIFSSRGEIQKPNSASKIQNSTLVDPPVPTPDVLYSCSFDPRCEPGKNTLQICSLKCVHRPD